MKYLKKKLLSLVTKSQTNCKAFFNMFSSVVAYIKKIITDFKHLVQSLVNGLRTICKPNPKNLLLLKGSIQKSYNRLNKLKKFALFIYVIFNIYRGIFYSPLFFLFNFLVPFYLFLFQQRRIKGFIRIKQRDTRVRLKHYYENFYCVWLFVNLSFVFVVFCGLTIYHFEFIANHLVTLELFSIISLDEFKTYLFFYFLLVTAVNWLTNLYIILFKNNRVLFKNLAIQEITIGAAIGSYATFQHYINLTNPEDYPITHYLHHSFDPLGRGYHFRTKHDIVLSHCVLGALGHRYDPKLFLDDQKYFDSQRLLGFVWQHRFEVGGMLNEKQKAQFPSWVWSPAYTTKPNELIMLKDFDGAVIGCMVFDKDHHLVPQFQLGVEAVVAPFYHPANLNSMDSSDEEFMIFGTALDLDSSTESKEECMSIISPVTSQESSTSIASVGAIIDPGSNPRAK